MYKLIGADQKEYGPVSGQQLRQWFAEGRVNAETSICKEGETSWRPFSAVPEFADLTAKAPPRLSSAPPPLSAMGTGMPGMDTRAHAMQEMRGPAIALIVTAALGIAFALLKLAMVMTGAGLGNLYSSQMFPMQQQNPQFEQLIRSIQHFTGFGGAILAIIGGIFVIYGALKMMKLENHGLCIGVSIVAMLPCISPCCIIGFPVGIWALIMLNKPEIKNSFT